MSDIKRLIHDTAAEAVRFNQCSREWHTWRDNHFGEADQVKRSGKDIIAAAGPEPASVARPEAADVPAAPGAAPKTAA